MYCHEYLYAHDLASILGQMHHEPSTHTLLDGTWQGCEGGLVVGKNRRRGWLQQERDSRVCGVGLRPFKAWHLWGRKWALTVYLAAIPEEAMTGEQRHVIWPLHPPFPSQPHCLAAWRGWHNSALTPFRPLPHPPHTHTKGSHLFIVVLVSDYWRSGRCLMMFKLSGLQQGRVLLPHFKQLIDSVYSFWVLSVCKAYWYNDSLIYTDVSIQRSKIQSHGIFIHITIFHKAAQRHHHLFNEQNCLYLSSDRRAKWVWFIWNIT